MVLIDLSELIPEKTSRGDIVISDVSKNDIVVTYTRKRGRPRPCRIKRYIDKEIFLLGITIWACEGTRRRFHELEISNSSEVITDIWMTLLRGLGIDKLARFRVQALENEVKKCELFWEKKLGISKTGKPITHIRKIRSNSNGVVNIRINSTILKELFVYWVHILPTLLQ